MKDVVSICLIVIPSIMLILCLIKKYDNFLDLRSVIKNYFSLFNKAKLQIWTFYILPIFISIGISMKFVPYKSYYGQQNVIISIFISLLITILSIIVSKDYYLVNKNYSDTMKKKIKRVIEETCNAIIFNVCLCVLLMMQGLVIVSIKEQCKTIMTILGSVSYYFMIVILLNMLLIIKRLDKLIRVFNNSAFDGEQ